MTPGIYLISLLAILGVFIVKELVLATRLANREVHVEPSRTG